jgi:xylose isomerase
VKLATILSNFGNRSDRFLSSGYSGDQTLEEQFDFASQVPELEGVELVGTWHLTPASVEEVREHLERTQLHPVSVIPNLFGDVRFGRGAFTSHDAGIRRQAIDETKLLTDLARDIGCDTVCLWPGQDGYDYPLQYDYAQAFEWLASGVRECADYAPDIRFALEYKPKEPRNRSFASTADRSLLLVSAVARPNVGVTLDTGHALMAYENPGESVALLQRDGRKLFHVHLNDNYRLWDDDLIFGVVHPVEMLEFVYWLRRTGYDGWCSFDQYPYREDAVRAIAESVRWFRLLEAAVEAGTDALGRVLETGDATAASALVREVLGAAFRAYPAAEAVR